MKIVVTFGGDSVEHEISIISAFQVIEVLKTKYEVIPVYISKSNKFYYSSKVCSIEEFKKHKYKKREIVKFINKNGFYINGIKKIKFDLIFPIVHGKGVEDGTLLAYFRFMGFDVVGDNLSFYSACQNKKITKMLLGGIGINNVSYKCFARGDKISEMNLTFPVILKPNNLGSSIGIKIANDYFEFEKYSKEILKMDNLVLIEEYLENSREFNVAVLNNNGAIEVSKIEEVIKEGLYSYEDKYLSNNKKKGMNYSKCSNFEIEKEIEEEIKCVAKKIYKEFGASGVIRIDFLYKDKLYVNEINSIPGSYAHYLWNEKYDFLELLDVVIKETKRSLFFLNKEMKHIKENIIFEGLNNY